MAAKFLGELRAAEAVRPLIQLLGAGDRVMRSSAAEALAAIGETEAVPALIERLPLEREVVPRTFVITALGNLGDERALKPLCELLTEDDILVRQSAANALGLLGSPEAPNRSVPRRLERNGMTGDDTANDQEASRPSSGLAKRS